MSNECAACYGQGVITKRETVEFRIKAGTRDGQRIRLAGKGNAGVHGGPAGDLYLIIKAGDASDCLRGRVTTFTWLFQ